MQEFTSQILSPNAIDAKPVPFFEYKPPTKTEQTPSYMTKFFDQNLITHTPKDKLATPKVQRSAQQQCSDLLYLYDTYAQIYSLKDLTLDEEKKATNLKKKQPERLKRMAQIWANPAVRTIFNTVYVDAITNEVSLAEAPERWTQLMRTRQELKTALYAKHAEKFQEGVARIRNKDINDTTLIDMDIAELDVEIASLDSKLDLLEKTAESDPASIKKRGGIDVVTFDKIALLGYLQVGSLREHLNDPTIGIALARSREMVFEKLLRQVTSGQIFHLLYGPTGSGKTSFVRMLAKRLTGKDPEENVGRSTIGLRELVGTTVTEDVGGKEEVGIKLGPFAKAITGANDTFELKKFPDKLRRAFCLFWDEINRFPEDLSEHLKLIEGKLPGDKIRISHVSDLVNSCLAEGFFFIGAMNPPGIKYRREPMNPTIARLFPDPINITYPPMEHSENPDEVNDELWKTTLAILMDNNKNLRLDPTEFMPKFIEKTEKGKTSYELAEKHSSEHGFGYRYILAVAELHKNMDDQPNDLSDGKNHAEDVDNEKPWLESEVISMSKLRTLLQGYKAHQFSGVLFEWYVRDSIYSNYTEMQRNGKQKDAVVWQKMFAKFGIDDIDIHPDKKKSPKDLKPICEKFSSRIRNLSHIEVGKLLPSIQRPVILDDEYNQQNVPTEIFELDPENVLAYKPVHTKAGEKTLLAGDTTLDLDKDKTKYKYMGIAVEGINTGKLLFAKLDKEDQPTTVIRNIDLKYLPR